MNNEIAWAGMRFPTPDRWEVCRHSVSCRNGSLVLADRRRQRLELTWRDCPREPDLAHGCRDLRDRFRAEDGEDRCRPLPAVRGWTGFVRRTHADSGVAYAMRWDPASGRIFQANVVLRDDDPIPHDRMTESILAGFRDSGFVDRSVRWKAFGIDCRPPSGWTLASTRVIPMDVTFRFRRDAEGGHAPDAGEAAVQRLGMADTWFNGDARAYLRCAAAGSRFTFVETSLGGHRAVAAAAPHKTRPWQRITGHRRERRELLWQCERVNSVFRITAVGSAKRDVTPEDFSARCPCESEDG
jgi:hypothetical protein